MKRVIGNTGVFIAPDRYYESYKRTIKHDESGQVFREISLRGGPMTSDWVQKTQGSSREAACSRSSGCASLVNMAIRSALGFSFNITAENLEGLPWEVASLLWERLVASRLVSVKVWQAFAAVYPNEDVHALKRKHYVIARPNMKLADYIAPLVSTSLLWVTFLSLSNIACSRTDLVQIFKLTNLGVLTIGQQLTTPDIGFDDSIIRSWSKLASSSDGFGLLRVLNCRSQRHITANVFVHLSQFPALCVFNVEDCNFGPQHRQAAQNQGWNYTMGKNLSGRLELEGAIGTQWDSIIHASFQFAGAFSERTLTAERVEAINAIPVLHLSVGPTQPDALVDELEDQSLKLFYREGVDRTMIPKKRRLSQTLAPSIKPSYKKTALRASKQQKLVDFLTRLGG